ncbi:MAG: hypothetical protein QM831_24545 [Kofleriaceae bacterium]
MAPMAPVGKAGALAQLRAGRDEVWLGSPHPFVMIVEQAGVWRIRDLVVNPEDEQRERAKSLAAGRGWMPEQYYGLGKPTGKIHLEAANRDAMIAAIEKLDWPKNW